MSSSYNTFANVSLESSATNQDKQNRRLSISQKADLYDEHAIAAEALSDRLASIDEDEDMNHRVITDMLGISNHSSDSEIKKEGGGEVAENNSVTQRLLEKDEENGNRNVTSGRAHIDKKKWMLSVQGQEGSSIVQKLFLMVLLAIALFMVILVLFLLGNVIVGPPEQPVGPYELVDLQVSSFVSVG